MSGQRNFRPLFRSPSARVQEEIFQPLLFRKAAAFFGLLSFDGESPCAVLAPVFNVGCFERHCFFLQRSGELAEVLEADFIVMEQDRIGTTGFLPTHFQL